ncbi:fibrobacter succinogenes major paralogous domain-containing protein [Fibrobacter sp. UWR1]|uniref:fibrobacter succinogenes major paralogous domain-containing protein n=1 Tax=Fibrobacter sp. UWR1 TaxID=2135645 RepID=UPI000DB25E3B|nr:FISUMP domain-containing protein [Fibrobacter sp. UWR1]PZW72574.1 uncharacterized protein (TIGR02145 family) [Fibrobacter sp. UWR1]
MKILKIAGFAIPLTLIACGDSGTTENITNNYTSGMEIAEKVSDLPKCTTDNEGDQVWVKEKGAASICVDGKWNVIGGSGAAADFGCETKNLADGSGVAIYCAGDSIGVVLNGKDGAKGDKGDIGETGAAGADGKDGVDGKDGAQGLQGEKGDAGSDGMPGIGCKVVSQTEDAVTIQCGDDLFSMNLNGGSGEVVVPGEDVVSLAKLSGVSQKGPFINGSTVTLFELDGSRSLVQTGRTFGGEIITDDGRFSVNNVSLKSSYVRMTANGFYRNEVTGKNSTASIVLNAYSDLQARSSVNINLLTHLEYYRVGYLMENGLESTIKASKKRAQKEIFAAFGIDNDGFGYSEDLDVFGEGDQNAALLAMSILLQGDRSEADLSALLASFGKDIEEDGTWDDKATRGTIANWAALRDGAGNFGVYRGYVERWDLGSVPEFEKYLRNFWSREYGLGVCGSDTVPVGTVKNATNNNGKASNDYAATYTSQTNKNRFICVDADSLKWREATDIEKDTMGLKHGELTTHEQASVINGQINTDYVYVYEGKQYRRGTDLDKNLGLGGCTKARVDSVWKSGSAWYTCVDTIVPNSKLNSLGIMTVWRTSTDIEKDTIHWSTLKSNFDGEVSKGQITDNYYIYEKSKGAWRNATQVEYDTYGIECSAEKIASTMNGLINTTKIYACNGTAWVFKRDNPQNHKFGTVADVRDNQVYLTVTIGSQTWMAENLNYDYNEGTAKSYCYSNSSANCDEYGRLYLWSAAMDSAAVFSNAGKGCGYGTTCAAASTSSATLVRGVCPEGWHLPSNSDWSILWTAIGGTSTAGTKLKSTSDWNSGGNGEDAYGFSVLPAGRYYNGSFYAAGNNGVFWSSTEGDSSNAYNKNFGYNNSDVYEDDYGKSNGFSVRCLRNSN